MPRRSPSGVGVSRHCRSTPQSGFSFSGPENKNGHSCCCCLCWGLGWSNTKSPACVQDGGTGLPLLLFDAEREERGCWFTGSTVSAPTTLAGISIFSLVVSSSHQDLRPQGGRSATTSTSPRCRPATGLGVVLYYAPARQRDRSKSFEYSARHSQLMSLARECLATTAVHVSAVAELAMYVFPLQIMRKCGHPESVCRKRGTTTHVLLIP